MPDVDAQALTPPDVPQPVIADIDLIRAAVWTLFDTLQERLTLVEDRAASIVTDLHAMHTSLTRIARSVEQLTPPEQTVDERLQDLRADLDTYRCGVRQRAIEASGEP